MHSYLILQNPGHNRVYYNLSGELALAELKIASRKLASNCEKIEITNINNIRYLELHTKKEITPSDLEILSKLSFVFALFKRHLLSDDTYLYPIQKLNYELIDPKISSIQKYAGKTNELFTKMMINVALLSSNFNYSDTIHLLDPVAGKGTTLFEGTVYGFDVTGVEIEKNSVHDTTVFFKKYLEKERYKHLSNTKKVYGKNKSEAVYAHEFSYAKNKIEFKSKETQRKLTLVNGNTLKTSKYFKKEEFHLIIGDLPYGVAHGNTTSNNSNSITRNPSELLNQCLPEWQLTLKKGGTVVIAWNSFVVSRKKLEQIFLNHSFHVFTEAPYNQFEHMVDKSIKRDIIVAQKK